MNLVIVFHNIAHRGYSCSFQDRKFFAVKLYRYAPKISVTLSFFDNYEKKLRGNFGPQLFPVGSALGSVYQFGVDKFITDIVLKKENPVFCNFDRFPLLHFRSHLLHYRALPLSLL